jgi:hypothetical protein
MNQKPNIDTVIEEIHKYRREVSERFQGDVRAIAADAAARMAASGRPVWNVESPSSSAESSHPELSSS